MKLQSFKDADGPLGYHHYCPGCDHLHVIYTTGKVAWTFNNDMDKPTFEPSVKHYQPVYEKVRALSDVSAKTTKIVKVDEKVVCHYRISKGNILFYEDCTHKLKSQTVPLPEIPEMYGV